VLQDGDILLTQGAGNVGAIAGNIKALLEEQVND
jgi:UDP-N-acetylmuramate-alanine ligase